jgi:glycerol-3-phosphate cytidylyltransferase
MIRIDYAPGAFDLFHIGHLNLLRRAKDHCNFLIVGVVADDVLIRHKGVTPVISLVERLEIVRSLRFVDMAIRAMTDDKVEIWNDLHFNVVFKGSDWRGTEKGGQFEREFVPVGVEVVFFPYTLATSSRSRSAAPCETSMARPAAPANMAWLATSVGGPIEQNPTEHWKLAS